ncbi:MAG: FMN-binding protein [Oscillospiraceae bacterium]
MYKSIVKPTLALVIICVIVSGLLAFTYNFARIAELGNGIDAKKLDEIKIDVLPKSTKLVFNDFKFSTSDVLGVYIDEGKNGTAIFVSSKGYAGDIKILVGFDNEGKITGSKTIETKESPGIGTKTEQKSFTDNFVGKKEKVATKKDGGEIDFIAGATISSRAYTNAINTAMSAYKEYVATK